MGSHLHWQLQKILRLPRGISIVNVKLLTCGRNEMRTAMIYFFFVVYPLLAHGFKSTSACYAWFYIHSSQVIRDEASWLALHFDESNAIAINITKQHIPRVTHKLTVANVSWCHRLFWRGTFAFAIRRASSLKELLAWNMLLWLGQSIYFDHWNQLFFIYKKQKFGKWQRHIHYIYVQFYRCENMLMTQIYLSSDAGVFWHPESNSTHRAPPESSINATTIMSKYPMWSLCVHVYCIRTCNFKCYYYLVGTDYCRLNLAAKNLANAYAFWHLQPAEKWQSV